MDPMWSGYLQIRVSGSSVVRGLPEGALKSRVSESSVVRSLEESCF